MQPAKRSVLTRSEKSPCEADFFLPVIGRNPNSHERNFFRKRQERARRSTLQVTWDGCPNKAIWNSSAAKTMRSKFAAQEWMLAKRKRHWGSTRESGN